MPWNEPKKRLIHIARQAMLERGLSPDFPQAVLEELSGIQNPAKNHQPDLKDLRHLLWCSIDNDDSLDLDQLTVAERQHDGVVKISIAVADVDALVPKHSAIDTHAQVNTTSVYTPAKIFPMLPDKLSTNLTSLNEGEDRIAIIFEGLLNNSYEVVEAAIYRAMVNNKAKLAYSSVGAWLEGRGKMPEKLLNVPGLDGILQLQNRIAQGVKQLRHQHGALSLETIEAKPILQRSRVAKIELMEHNQAHELIENFMIVANTISAGYLAKNQIPSLRRVVRIPQRWDRIVALAADKGEALPAAPNSKALDEFLVKMKQRDPVTFPDLSLSVIKLLGRGEYVLEMPGDKPMGHFGLALRDYAHSTAPNRRYPDVIAQRLLKASLMRTPHPYTVAELENLAAKCTEKEDAADKVERRVRKSAAAMLLASHLNEQFEAIVTGAASKGTWVRIFNPPVEGKLVAGMAGLDVGDRLRVKLIEVDIEKGFIDFVRA